MTFVAEAQQVADQFERKLGEDYDQNDPPRLCPYCRGTDCSGGVVCAVEAAAWANGHTDYRYPATVTVTQYATVLAAGLARDWDDSLLAVPAIQRWEPFDPFQGWGNLGHTGITRGDLLHMLESWGGGGVSITPANFEGWGPKCGQLVDVDYTAHGVTPAPSVGPIPLVRSKGMVKFLLGGRTLCFMANAHGALVCLSEVNGLLYPEQHIVGPGSARPDVMVDSEYPGGGWSIDGIGAEIAFRDSTKMREVRVRVTPDAANAGAWVNTEPVFLGSLVG